MNAGRIKDSLYEDPHLPIPPYLPPTLEPLKLSTPALFSRLGLKTGALVSRALQSIMIDYTIVLVNYVSLNSVML